MKQLNEDEIQVLHDALKAGHIDRTFLATRTDDELREYLEQSDYRANEPTEEEVKKDHVQGEVQDHNRDMHELGKRLGLE